MCAADAKTEPIFENYRTVADLMGPVSETATSDIVVVVVVFVVVAAAAAAAAAARDGGPGLWGPRGRARGVGPEYEGSQGRRGRGPRASRVGRSVTRQVSMKVSLQGLWLCAAPVA